MYSQYYGLRQDPFGVTPDPQYLYVGGIHAEALASLIYGIENNRGFLALIGPPGTGKTTLLFHLLESFRATAHTAFIFQTKCTSDEFLRYLLHELGIDDSGKDLVHANNLFNELLLRAASSGKRVLVIIDEAQNLDRGVLETVRLLSNFETPHSKLLQIILAGQPGLAKELAHHDLRQLRQRLAAVIHLRPLTLKESSEYIDLRLKIAGYGGPPLFTQNARELLIDQSEGIPRNINILCFNALSIGYALGSRVINEAIIQEVIEDSSLEEQPFHALASDRIGAGRRDQLYEPVAVSQPLTAGIRRSATPASSIPNSPARTTAKGQYSSGSVANRLPNLIPPKSSKNTPRSGRPSDFGPREQSVIKNLQVASGAPGPRPVTKSRGRRSNSLPFTLTLLLFVLLWSAAVIWRFEFQTSSQASAPRTLRSETQTNSAASPSSSDSASRGAENSGRPKPKASPTIPARPSPAATAKVDRTTTTGDTDERPAIQPTSAETIDLTSRSEIGDDRSGISSITGGAKETEPVDPLSGLARSNASWSALSTTNRAIESVAVAPTLSSISLYPSPRRSTPSYFVAEAELIRSIVPEYPEEARRIKLEGSVVLMATIAADGSVQKVERLSGNQMLAGAASRSVRHWHYRPASVNGKPVEAKAKIVLNFSLHNNPN